MSNLHYSLMNFKLRFIYFSCFQSLLFLTPQISNLIHVSKTPLLSVQNQITSIKGQRAQQQTSCPFQGTKPCCYLLIDRYLYQSLAPLIPLKYYQSDIYSSCIRIKWPMHGCIVDVDSFGYLCSSQSIIHNFPHLNSIQLRFLQKK